jgi:hypothetical protein
VANATLSIEFQSEVSFLMVVALYEYEQYDCSQTDIQTLKRHACVDTGETTDRVGIEKVMQMQEASTVRRTAGLDHAGWRRR